MHGLRQRQVSHAVIEGPNVVPCRPESVGPVDDEFGFVVQAFDRAVIDGHAEVVEDVAFVAALTSSEDRLSLHRFLRGTERGCRTRARLGLGVGEALMFPIVQTPGVKQFNGANPKGGSRGGGTPRTRVSRKPRDCPARC